MKYLKIYIYGMLIFLLSSYPIISFIVKNDELYECVGNRIENLDFNLKGFTSDITIYKEGNLYGFKKRYNTVKRINEGTLIYSYQICSFDSEYLLYVYGRLILGKWVLYRLNIYSADHSIIPYFSTRKELLYKKEFPLDLNDSSQLVLSCATSPTGTDMP